MIETYLNPDAAIDHSITKEKLDTRLFGSQTIYSVVNIPINCKETHAIITDSSILSFESQPEEGSPIEIFINHQIDSIADNLHNITVTLPNSGNYKCVCPDTIEILEGEYAKISARTFGTTTYIDAQTFYYIDVELNNIMTTAGVQNTLLKYNDWYLGMTSSHTTTSTTNLKTAIENPIYHFNVNYSRMDGQMYKVYIQNVGNTSYYINGTSWGTSGTEFYYDNAGYFGTNNKTDGSNRLYMSSATALTNGKNTTAVWEILKPIKTAK